MRSCWAFAAVMVVACGHVGPSTSTGLVAHDYSGWSSRDWKSPPKLFLPMVRWWWPGGRVTGDGILSEIAQLDSVGFGGVEIQPFTIGLSGDSSAETGVRTVGTAAFVARVDTAIAEARRRDMQADLTMSSGWGLGAAIDCAECGTQQLLMSEFDVAGPGTIDSQLPRPVTAPYEKNRVANLLGLVGPFDTNLELVAVLRGQVREPQTAPLRTVAELADLVDLTDSVREGRLRASIPSGRFRVYVIYSNLTNTRLAGAAYPGDHARFRTIDHLDGRGLSAFRRSYFDALARGLRTPPDHYFVDSFEFLADLPWTPSFRASFSQARGYDITKYLPLLFTEGGEFFFNDRTTPLVTMEGVGERVREDYVDVRADLFQNRFMGPLNEAVQASGARLRLQALGGYGDYLDVFSRADVPEAEDFGLNGVSEFLRLASSAAHVAGHRRASNEAFVGSARKSTALTEDEYHRIAGRAFAAGLNQLVYHGRAYPVPDAAGAGWYPFERFNITTRLDETNPVWPRLAHLNATFGRIAYAMTRGRPAAQVAWLLNDVRPPEFDPPAQSDQLSNGGHFEPYRELSAVTRALRQHAVGYDRVSRSALASSARICGRRVCIGDGVYDMILVDHAAVASADWLVKLRQLASVGIQIVFVGSEAKRARGFVDTAARDQKVHEIMAQLVRMAAYRRVATADELGPILRELTLERPFRPTNPASWVFATAERTLPLQDLLLIFNGTMSDRVAEFEVRLGGEAQILDPEDFTEPPPFRVSERQNVRVPIPQGRSRIVRLVRTQ